MSRTSFYHCLQQNLRRIVSSLVLMLALHFSTAAQFQLYDTIPFNKRKLTTIAVASTAVYSLGLIGLNEVWYKENPRESFHFFNDNNEWMQVDKVGHFYSAYYLSAFSAKAINNGGVSSKKSALLGAVVGFTALLGIEILDGYSAAYGASAGDLVANAAGSAFYWIQQTTWKELRLQPKFSFHQTDYASLRPEVLGDGFMKEMLKDYNGQTYWLSVDVDKFTRFPKWLNIAVGYGAEGMIYATNEGNEANGYQTAIRQYYLGIDFDLSSIRTHSKVVKALLTMVSMVRLPAPACSFSSEGVRFHPFYF